MENTDFIYGRNPVKEALKAGRSINKLYIADIEQKGPLNEIVAIAKQQGIIIKYLGKDKLDAIVEEANHQGVVAYVSPVEYVEVDDLFDIAKEKEEDPFIVILEGITDPHNMGSIIRTCEAAGVHGIIIPKRRAAGVDSVVAKCSAGAIEYVKVAKVTNIAQTIESLKKKGVWIAGAGLSGKDSCFESNLKGPLVIVIGSEGRGMSRLVEEKCDFVVRIPMKGNIQSLNASVAAGILMYEVVRQRTNEK